VHVHGLGVNPADGQVHVATHFGLWRLDGPSQAERVGDYFYDLMGFTVVDEDYFLASGHPLLTDDLPPLLGLVESSDAGQTWRSVSLLGEADFHALRVAHEAVWGWNSSDGALLASDDGRDWERRSTVSSLLDFVVDPDDPERLVAAVAAGLDDAGLQRSGDGGRTWDPVEGPALARLAWQTPDRLWGVAMDGTVWCSRDGGDTWNETGTVDGAPEAFADAGDRLLVAAGGAVAQSLDGGATWDRLHREH
jgi:photosystem II stability/assembly factor-like uncharacterized protein